MLCPKCHHRNASGWKYCIACGSRLNANSNKKVSHSSAKYHIKSTSKNHKSSNFSNKGIFILNSILIILIVLGTMTIVNIYGKDIGKTFINYLDVRKNFDASDWSRFEVAEGNYSVLTPNEPKMQKVYRSMPQLDKPLAFNDYTDALDSENIISFAYAKYPSNMSIPSPDSIFDVLMNEILLQNNSQSVEGTDENFLGYPSVQFSGQSLDEENKWYVRYLIFIKGHNIYILSYKDRTQEYKGFEALKSSFKLND